jgi:hypothetical protein
MCLGHCTAAAAQASLVSARMFITPTLCGRTVDTAFRDDESYVSDQPASLRWIIRRDGN